MLQPFAVRVRCILHTAGLLAGMVLAVAPSRGGEAGTVPEPEGYRLEDLRAPVPRTLSGATVLDTDALRGLLAGRSDVILIDVLPAPRRPKNLRPSALWLPKKRRNIPGSVWLPNTGYGILPVEEETYLRDNLQRLTADESGRPLVFYCLAQCWMSWNAAKRALSWGYANVYWYPEGTDGWAAANLPLQDGEPLPRTGE